MTARMLKKKQEKIDGSKREMYDLEKGENKNKNIEEKLKF